MAQTTEEKEAAKAAKEAEKEAAKAADLADEITVTWPGGSRVYSKDVHGDKRMEYAEEFASKHEGSTIA